jgi:hypothetical protein
MRTDRALYKHGFTDADPTADNSSPRNTVDSDVEETNTQQATIYPSESNSDTQPTDPTDNDE